MSERQKTPAGGACELAGMLQDHLDGRLTEGQQARLEEHLTTCEACAAELAAQAALLAEVEALPRSVTPESDLWTGIRPRLTARRAAPRRAAGRSFWWMQAAAALAFMALGAGLAQLAPGTAVPAAPTQTAPPQMASATPAALEPQSQLAVVEADLLRAKEELWMRAYEGRRHLSPATVEVVEKNLRLIDSAIRELRAALAEDPGNHQLESLLFSSHRREIDLLQRLAQTTHEI